MATFTKDRLGQTITKGQDNEGNPSVQIIGNLSPEEYQMRRYLNERADQERYASLNTPTYSGDPNRIAEGNALAEMKRTGLDRYYHPNSAAYYAAFQGIRDKYLQQEMAKKAAIENEGKQLYSNRMGAFDKLIQDQYGLQKQKVESVGLEGLRRSQAKQAEAIAKSYEGDGFTPKEKAVAAKKEADKIKEHQDKVYGDVSKKYIDMMSKGEEITPEIIEGFNAQLADAGLPPMKQTEEKGKHFWNSDKVKIALPNRITATNKIDLPSDARQAPDGKYYRKNDKGGWNLIEKAR